MPRCLLQHLLASMLLESKAQAADVHPACMLTVPSQAFAGQQEMPRPWRPDYTLRCTRPGLTLSLNKVPGMDAVIVCMLAGQESD